MKFDILIICTGNTCRSAMAEGILKEMLKETGDKETSVSSAGIATCPGWGASSGAMGTCKERGIDLSAHSSSMITLERIRQADLILTMEKMHSDRVLDIDRQADNKVKLLAEFDSRTKEKEVPDPVGMDMPVFRRCADMITGALEEVMRQLPEMKKEKFQLETQPKRMAIGADHRGFPLKEATIKYLNSKNYEVVDCGTDSTESADHPDQAHAVAELVKDGKVDRGILICSNGIGMTIVSNKVPGVYAALVGSEADAKQCREHNGANVVCYGENISEEQSYKILDTFLTTDPLEGEKYERRRNKVKEYEGKYLR